MAKLSTDELLDAFKELTLIELSEFVKQFEDTFGVTAAAPVAVAAAPCAGSERTPEVFLFDADRRLRYHGAIDDSRDEEHVAVHYLRDALDALLSGGDPPIGETHPVGCTVKWLDI